MKKRVLERISRAIERSADKELREWPPSCTVGLWYQPKRPAAPVAAVEKENVAEATKA